MDYLTDRAARMACSAIEDAISSLEEKLKAGGQYKTDNPIHSKFFDAALGRV